MNVINPKLCGNEKAVFWFPITHYCLKLHCPEHNTVHEPALWTNLVETKSPRNPRLVHDLSRNTLLVQRFHFCGYGEAVDYVTSPLTREIVEGHFHSLVFFVHDSLGSENIH
ncbi:Hypothetical predicted protein, partial [Paramuricea clavata]